jgi:hypothetical protein
MTTTYVTVADVQSQLNASYDAVNKVYTVYGINITEASFQAHTDFANMYINAVVGADLDTTDYRYMFAVMAAKDLAAMRILVVSSGGALIGAFDYFLGDLRVARSGPYAAAIERAITGFREDLARQMLNLALPVKAAEASAAGDVPTYSGGLISP